MRVLLLADHCNPRFASTPFFGYQIIRALAGVVERVTLATQVRNRGAFTREEIGVAELELLDTEYVARPMYRLALMSRRDADKAQTLGVAAQYPSNLTFEREAWKRFGGRLRRGEFDIVHRVTPLSPTLASPMARWSPVPFVLGPVNGGLRWPPAFRAELARESEWLTYLRGAHTILPYYRSTFRCAAAILAGFAHTAERLPASCRPRVIDCSDVGYEDPPDRVSPTRPAREVMTILFVGRLVPYKCPDVLVRAFAERPALRRHRLVIVGEGPDRPLLERLIAEHDLRGCVELAGWQPHPEVMRRMAEADVFAFPSIRELGAGVVLEAMGSGPARGRGPGVRPGVPHLGRQGPQDRAGLRVGPGPPRGAARLLHPPGVHDNLRRRRRLTRSRAPATES